MPTIDFEGLTASDAYAGISFGYGGIDWTNFGVVGSQWLATNLPLTDGYDSALQDDALAYIYPIEGSVTATLTGSGGSTFTLKSGTFAAAFNTGEKLTFTAFVGGEKVGKLSVIVDTTAQEIEFDRKFKHVDTVQIKATGGTDANPDDDVNGGTGGYIGLDNLEVKPDAPAAALLDHLDGAHPFAVPQVHYDWLI
jgi:hypothetical protein